MKTCQVVLTATIVALAALGKFQFVGFDGGVCAAGAKPLGVSNDDYKQGESAGIDTIGIAIVCAGAAIDVGSAVEVDSDGQAITKTTGVIAGYALDPATVAGEYIRVKLA